MPRGYISNVVALTKEAFAGEVANDRLNPLHLTVATTGSRIQSQTWRIPDRIGFFSSGPPRLQVHEGAIFIVSVLVSCLTILLGAFLVTFAKLCGMPNILEVSAIWLLMTLAQATMIWVVTCCSPRRAPGYEWEDWKLRKE